MTTYTQNQPLEFPAWPSFHPDSLQDIVEPLKTSQVNYWTGTKGKAFEDAFAKRIGSKMAISCSSGTAALHTILGSMNIGPGDEVIVPSYSFIASSFSILQAGGIPIFCDVFVDHTLDHHKLESLVTKRTKAIVVVHLYGVVCDMDPILDIAKRYDLKVIEDAAQCIGGKYKGKNVGTLGDAAAFSFCQSKHFTTGGEGGMVTTNNTELGWECRSFRDHGFDIKKKMDLLELEQTDFYIHNRIGYNYRMTEIQSIIGLNELKRLDDWNLPKRRQFAAIYDEMISGHPLIASLPLNHADRENAYWLYPIVFKAELIEGGIEQLYNELKSKGIPISKVQWPEAYKEKVFKQLSGFGHADFPFKSTEYTSPDSVDYSNVVCPTSRSLAERTISLHLHPSWEIEHVEHCARTLLEVLTQVEKAGATS